MNILLWVTCAKRQLTTLELQHALATKPGMHDLDRGDLPNVADMVSVCGGLVTVDEESKILRLVHSTTHEYLMQIREHWFPGADSTIATTCVTYLSFSVFETGLCKTDEEFKQRLLSNPLCVYAAHHWGHHVSEDTEPVQTVLHFLQHRAKVKASSQVLTANELCAFYGHSFGYSQRVPKNVRGLHLVGYFGLSRVAGILLGSGQNPDVKDTYGRTPLWHAAQNGHMIVTKQLLAAGANVNASDDYTGRTALYAAARGGYLEIVEKLLSAGADVNSITYHRRTVLQVAAGGGHLKIIEKLLAAKADASAVDEDDRTALYIALKRGHLGIVKRLKRWFDDENKAS